MASWNDYHLPHSLDEALQLLASYDGRARVVAGGTDLFVERLSHGHRTLDGHPPLEALVDVSRIEGLDDIRLEDGFVLIGAAVTHARIVASELVRRHGTALAEGCSVIGGPQVRNVATLCGNVAHALPAADGTAALLALGAQGWVASAGGRRWIPLEELFLGPGRSAVDPHREILAAVRFPATAEREASAFTRVMRPQGVALPMFVVAVRVALDAAGQRYREARIALGPVAPVPFRSRAAEAALAGQAVGGEAHRRVVEAALGEVRPRTSRQRATREYRLEMVRTLLPRALETAAARARGEAWARPQLEPAERWSSFGGALGAEGGLA